MCFPSEPWRKCNLQKKFRDLTCCVLGFILLLYSLNNIAKSDDAYCACPWRNNIADEYDARNNIEGFGGTHSPPRENMLITDSVLPRVNFNFHNIGSGRIRTPNDNATSMEVAARVNVFTLTHVPGISGCKNRVRRRHWRPCAIVKVTIQSSVKMIRLHDPVRAGRCGAKMRK